MKHTHKFRFSVLFGFVLMTVFTFGIISCSSLQSFLNDPIAISWTGLSANGTAGSEATTELTLTFNKSTSSLKIENITVTGAVKGALGGTGNTRTLSISEITVGDGEEITVTITNPNIYDISPLSKSVAVHKGAATDGAGWPPTVILTRFGIDGMPMPTGAEDVTWSISEDGNFEYFYIRYTGSNMVYTWLEGNGWSLDYSTDGSYTFLKGARELQLVFSGQNNRKTIYVYSPLRR